MREIKCRAWHKLNKKMFEVFSFCPQYIKILVGIRTAQKLYRDEFEILMQFTGLKDKNGVEIYEGDILKYFNPYSKNEYVNVIKWDSLFAGFAFFDKIESRWAKESDFLKIIDTIEIIGNIYENPELLAVPTAVL